MKRRMFLTAIEITVTAIFAGCLSGESEPKGGNHTDDTEQSPTEDQAEETEVSPTKTEIPRVDSIYIENFDEILHRFRLEVTEKNTDNLILNNRYEVPAESGMEIPAIGREQQTYSVKVVIEDGPRRTYGWTVGDCDFNNGGDTALGVRMQDGDVNFLTNDCDAVSVGYELTYSNHRRYIIEE